MTRPPRLRLDWGLCLFLALALWASVARADEASIRLNTVGFLPDAPKRASVAAECSAFRVVRDADGGEVLAGKPAGTVKDEAGAQLAVLDFSALAEPGVYRLDVPGVGRWAALKIGAQLEVEPVTSSPRGK
jgi:endoglucanase